MVEVEDVMSNRVLRDLGVQPDRLRTVLQAASSPPDQGRLSGCE
jgi:hypothetical protein